MFEDFIGRYAHCERRHLVGPKTWWARTSIIINRVTDYLLEKGKSMHSTMKAPLIHDENCPAGFLASSLPKAQKCIPSRGSEGDFDPVGFLAAEPSKNTQQRQLSEFYYVGFLAAET